MYQDVTLFEWVILLLFGLSCLLYLYIQHNALSPRSKPDISINEILKTSQTGDLIFLSGNSKGEKSCKWFTGSVFSHVGMIIREKDDLYLWESDMGQAVKDGPRLILLKDKLKYYSGEKIGGYKKLNVLGLGIFRPRHPTDIDAMRIVPEYIDKKMDNTMLNWLFSGVGFGELFNNTSEIFCSELVAETLIKMGIIKSSLRSGIKISSSYSISPEDFNKGKVPLNSGYSYGETKYFVNEN